MLPDTPEVEPTGRQWLGYWSMIVQQTQNAFNDKAGQFILIPLGAAVGFSVETPASLMIAIPFVLFAPMAGWMSDRFSKRNVIIGSAIAQLVILSLICYSVMIRQMPLALLGFFLLAVQSAFFSPAKMGINKELVGSKHLGFATGVQQMMATLAMLAGQIAAGWWFDRRHISLGGLESTAWEAAFFPLVLITAFSVPAIFMAISIPKVPAQSDAKLSGRLLVSHFKDLSTLWADQGIRRAAFGVAYFWGFAAFINLWSVKVAKSLTDGGGGFGTLSSIFMASAALGMVIGFACAAFLLRKKIELGWVPVAGILMTVSSLVLAFLPADGWLFLTGLGFLAFSSALFLAPLNAWLQDRYPADKRGELQSAVNLQDCLAAIFFVIAIEVMILLTRSLGVSDITGFRIQLIAVGFSCALITAYAIRLLAIDLIRLVCLAWIKTFYRIKFTGTERIPKAGGALLLPNHVSFADTFFVSAVSNRPIRFVMESSYMKSSLIRSAANLFSAVPIQRDQPLEAVRRTIEALEQGDLVVLFPEGKLTQTGTLSDLERGFELIARKAKVPILPIWVDGSWGSIFSSERGRLFKKKPYTSPWGLSIAVGEEITHPKPNCRIVQNALLKTSALALRNRFENPTPAQTNGYQLAQLEALPRGGKIHALKGDEIPSASLEEFAKQTKGEFILSDDFEPVANSHWIGSGKLRTAIEAKNIAAAEIRFHDVSQSALIPLKKENLIHLPALAIGETLIALSLPTPPSPYESRPPQLGNKPNAYGKLLPGFWIEDNVIHPNKISLPENLTLDPESFITAE